MNSGQRNPLKKSHLTNGFWEKKIFFLFLCFKWIWIYSSLKFIQHAKMKNVLSKGRSAHWAPVKRYKKRAVFEDLIGKQKKFFFFYKIE